MDAALSDDLLDAIGTVSAQLRLVFADLDDPQVGFVALATLRHLARHGPRSISDLAATDRVTTQAISLRVAPLARAGLVERRSDPGDARRTLVHLTPAGRRGVDRAQSRAHDALCLAIQTLGAPDRHALTAALPALLRLGAALADRPTTPPANQPTQISTPGASDDH